MSNKQYSIRLANGNLYLDFAVYNTYFPDINSIILLDKRPQILIMPVQQEGAGGLLLKIRNAKGDRVVNVTEFFQNKQIEIIEERIIPVIWNSDYSALNFIV
jgi:hypothetical protein